MERIKNPGKLEYYVKKYNIKEIFSGDIEPDMELISFEKKEHICRSQERLDYFYFLVEGKAKVYSLLKNGKALLLTFYRPLVVIGDVEIIDSDTATANVQALEKTFCIGVPMNKLRKNALDDAKFLQYVCKNLSYKLNRFSNVSSINLLYPLENRLAGYLLAITSDGDNTAGLETFFTHKLTEVADLLGTSYRHLSRTINKLCDKGIIERQHGTIVIRNKDLLKETAGDIYNF